MCVLVLVLGILCLLHFLLPQRLFIARRREHMTKINNNTYYIALKFFSNRYRIWQKDLSNWNYIRALSLTDDEWYVEMFFFLLIRLLFHESIRYACPGIYVYAEVSRLIEGGLDPDVKQRLFIILKNNYNLFTNTLWNFSLVRGTSS